MKKVQIVLILLLFITLAACRAESTPLPGFAATPVAVATRPVEPKITPMVDAAATPTGTVDDHQGEHPPVTATPTPALPVPTEDLPLLPSLRQEDDGLGLGEPLPGGAEDPFAKAAFTLTADLPTAPETAVVEHHSFSRLDEAKARQIANQLGFIGPLYVQQIPPEFAPPEGQAWPIVYTAFSRQSILTLSDTGVAYENRGVTADFSQHLDFAEVVPRLEEQLHTWNLLDFPYEFNQLPTGDLIISRLIDGLPVAQNAFNFALSQTGEIGFFDFQPLREVDLLGRYPLQTAAEAWAQLQTPDGRANGRYQMIMPVDPANNPFADFVNPRSWSPNITPGQELHVYITPSVYEATDGSGLRLVFGNLTLTGEAEDLAEIATHLSDALHVWGTTGLEDGTPTLSVMGWEQLNSVPYESLEGTVATVGNDTLLQTTDGETFILPAAPADLPEGLEIHLSVAGRRDTGAAYPVLDWMSITEKIVYPEVPLTPSEEDAEAIKEVTVDSAELIYFTLYQTVDVPNEDGSVLLLPVWNFLGTTDQGHEVTFWQPAVAPEYLQTSTDLSTKP